MNMRFFIHGLILTSVSLLPAARTRAWAATSNPSDVPCENCTSLFDYVYTPIQLAQSKAMDDLKLGILSEKDPVKQKALVDQYMGSSRENLPFSERNLKKEVRGEIMNCGLDINTLAYGVPDCALTLLTEDPAQARQEITGGACGGASPTDPRDIKGYVSNTINSAVARLREIALSYKESPLCRGYTEGVSRSADTVVPYEGGTVQYSIDILCAMGGKNGLSLAQCSATGAN